MSLTIHDFKNRAEDFDDLVVRLAAASGRDPEDECRELLSDWRFAAPRLDDLAVRAIDPGDERGAIGFAEKYVQSWYTRAASDALDRVWKHYSGEPGGVSRVVIQFPLQHGKDLHTSQLFPAAMFGRHPRLRIGAFGYSSVFAEDAIRNCGSIMRSRAYQEIYPGVAPGLSDQIPARQRRYLSKHLKDCGHAFGISYSGHVDPLKGLVAHTRGKTPWTAVGYYIASSWPNPVNGKPFDGVILSDPYKAWDGPHGVSSTAYNRTLWSAYLGTIEQRLQNERSFVVTCFTPWTNDDVNARLIEHWRKEGRQVLVIKAPAWGRPDTEEEIRLGIDRSYDPRKDGEILDPIRKGQKFYDRKAAALPPRFLNAHWKLDPRPKDSELFPISWWVVVQAERIEAAALDSSTRLLFTLDAADATSPDATTGSFAVLGVHLRMTSAQHQAPGIAHDLAVRFDEWRGRPDGTDLRSAILAFVGKIQRARGNAPAWFLVEPKAAGRGAVLADRDLREALSQIGVKMVSTRDLEKPDEGHLPVGYGRLAKSGKWDLLSALANPEVAPGPRVGIPDRAHGLVTIHWLETQPADHRPLDQRVGWLDELRKGATPNDRIDEEAQAAVCLLSDAWASEGQTVSFVGIARSLGIMF